MTLLVAGTFVCTFLVVCVIAYFLLAERGADSKSAPTRRGEGAEPARIGEDGRRPAADVGDNAREPGAHSPGGGRLTPLGVSSTTRINDDARQTLRDGSVLAYRLFQWFRDGPPDRAVEPPVMRGPMTAWTVAAAVAVLGVAVLVFLGVIAVGLKVFEYSVEPLLERATGPLFLLLFVPGVLPALALTVLAIGLPLSQKFRPRGRFITGLCAVAFGFVSLWQVPRLMAALPTPESRVQLEAPLLIVGLVVSAFLLVCGFQLMGSCKWVRKGEGGGDD
jgi:hypothetical protein